MIVRDFSWMKLRVFILYWWSSIKGRLIVLSLEAVESPRESSSFIPTSSFNPSSHSGSPFHEIVGYTTEEFSSNSLCSSPDEFCWNQIQAEQMAGQLRSLTHAILNGAVLAVCPYLDRYVLAAAGNTVWYLYAVLTIFFVKIFLKGNWTLLWQYLKGN